MARILKVVNSAFYGLPGQIGSINRAIVLLGLNAVKNIVIAASLAKLFRGGRVSPHFSAKDLWTHSIAVGVTSKLIVQKLNNMLPDEAFLAGLIHDMGILVELQAFREPLVEIAERATREQVRYVDLETQIIGVDHQMLGAGLTNKWKFPRTFQYVAGHHHNPQALALDCRWLTSVVHVADHVVTQQGLGYCADVQVRSDGWCGAGGVGGDAGAAGRDRGTAARRAQGNRGAAGVSGWGGSVRGTRGTVCELRRPMAPSQNSELRTQGLRTQN